MTNTTDIVVKTLTQEIQTLRTRIRKMQDRVDRYARALRLVGTEGDCTDCGDAPKRRNTSPRTELARFILPRCLEAFERGPASVQSIFEEIVTHPDFEKTKTTTDQADYTLRNVIRSLEQRGEIERIGPGRYRLTKQEAGVG